jgi:hypothetical protein
VYPTTYMDVCRRELFRGGQVFSTDGGLLCRNFFDRESTSRRQHSEPRHAGVLSSSGKPVSAKQNLSLPRPRGLGVFCQLMGFALLFLPSRMCAESLEDAAHELAMKVCVAAHKQPIKVAWQESQSSGYLSDRRKKVFLDQISACGMEAAENSDAPILTVTMQVTPSKALLIASSSEAASPQIYVIEVPRASLFVTRETAPAPQLKRELLWQQEKPIQSALEWQDRTTEERFLFLLSEGLFMRFDSENGVWKWRDSAQFLPVGRRPRDGEVSLFYSHAKARVELVLGKKVCDLDLTLHFGYTCTGTEVGDRTTELSSTCEESPRYLVTGKGDYTQTDRITLAGAAAAGARAAADLTYAGSVDMPGPVLDFSVAENTKAAEAVVKNLSTGNYEVYRITAVCSN